MTEQLGVIKQLTLTVAQLLNALPLLRGYTQKTDPMVVSLQTNR
jgi:hypothetical protein